MRKIEIDCSSERTPERMTSSRICAEYCQAKTASRPAERPSASILATDGVSTLWASSMSSETRRRSVVGQVVAGLDGAVQELQQQLGDEHGVVLADGGLGAGDDQDLAALEDAFEVERDGVAQERVDLAGGDEPLELVARRVERLGGEAAVGEQGGELAAPVVAREVAAGDCARAGGRRASR